MLEVQRAGRLRREHVQANQECEDQKDDQHDAPETNPAVDAIEVLAGVIAVVLHLGESLLLMASSVLLMPFALGFLSGLLAGLGARR